MDKRLIGLGIAVLGLVVFLLVTGVQYQSKFLMVVEYIAYAAVILGVVIVVGEFDERRQLEERRKSPTEAPSYKERVGRSTPGQIKEKLKKLPKKS